MDHGKPVLIPFKYSSPPEDVRSRGDKERFSQLVANIANWRMLQRDRLKVNDGEEYVIAEEQNFNVALEIATPFLKTTLTGLDKTSLQIIDFMLAQESKGTQYGFTIRDIQAGVRKEEGSPFSERYLREKLELLEQDNKVSINKDTKPYKITLLAKQQPSVSGLVKIVDRGESVLDEYENMGEVIGPLEGD